MPDPVRLLAEIDALIGKVASDARLQSGVWGKSPAQLGFQPSIENLAAYLALRHLDLLEM